MDNKTVTSFERKSMKGMKVDEVLARKSANLGTDVVGLSIIVTLNNQAQGVRQIYEQIVNVFNTNGQGFEILFVDDGSTDDSLSQLQGVKAQDARVRIVQLRTQFGEAAAFNAGLQIARGDVIVYFTGRVNINPMDLPKLLKKLEAGHDLVVGWRYPRRDSRLNQVVSNFFNKVSAHFSKVKLHDMNSGVLVARREVFKDISFYGNLINFIPIMAKKQGFRIAEVQVEQLPGKFEHSRYIKNYIRRFLDIITVIFLTNYSKKPLHFLGFLGAVFTAIGLLISIYLFLYRILGFGGIAGRPMLLLGVLLLVIGIQMISIGLLGEMIIFTHARKIKEYNIKEIFG